MKLSTQVKQCNKCKELSQGRLNVVIGEGPIPCSIVFLGEAPGRKEDISGMPFCGMAGDMLKATAFRYNLKQKVDYHLLNVLKCRPPNNRDPLQEEFNNCTPFLEKQLTAVKPKVVVAFGRYAQAFVLNKNPRNVTVLQNMGQVVKCKDYYAILSCHPAYVVRNPKVLEAFRAHIRKAQAISNGRIPKKCIVPNADLSSPTIKHRISPSVPLAVLP